MTELTECANGCTRKVDGTAIPLMATEGEFCERCHRRAENALLLVGPIVEHLMSIGASLSANQFEPTGVRSSKSEAPIPGQWQATSDAHDVYRKVAFWSDFWAQLFQARPRPPRSTAWRDAQLRIVGFGMASSAVPAEARADAVWLAQPLAVQLKLIFENGAAEDITQFLAELAEIDGLRRRYPTEQQPRVDRDTKCPGCLRAGHVVIYPVDYLGQDQRIVCKACDHEFDTTPVQGPLAPGQTFLRNEYEQAMVDAASAARDAHRDVVRAARKRERSEKSALELAKLTRMPTSS